MFYTIDSAWNDFNATLNQHEEENEESWAVPLTDEMFIMLRHIERHHDTVHFNHIAEEIWLGYAQSAIIDELPF